MPSAARCRAGFHLAFEKALWTKRALVKVLAERVSRRGLKVAEITKESRNTALGDTEIPQSFVC